MSDTPETDNFINSLNDDWDIEFAALTAHARKLERQRNKALDAVVLEFVKRQHLIKSAEMDQRLFGPKK